MALVAEIRGMKIFGIDYMPKYVPRMSLSDSVPVRADFRLEMNIWLEEFFGSEMCVVQNESGLFMHPDHIKLLLKVQKGEIKISPD